MPYVIFYAWIYLFHVVLVFGSTSFHAFHVYGLTYMYYVSPYVYLHACAKIYGSYACFYALRHAHMSRPMCLCLCLHVYMLRSLSSHVFVFGFFFHMLRSTSLHAYMFRSTCFHAICRVFMLWFIFSLYCCLDLHAYMLDITFLAMPCLDLHVYMHVPMPICVDLCFHMLTCLGLLLYMLYAISHVRSICLRASCHVYVFRPRLYLSYHVLL